MAMAVPVPLPGAVHKRLCPAAAAAAAAAVAEEEEGWLWLGSLSFRSGNPGWSLQQEEEEEEEGGTRGAPAQSRTAPTP